MERLNVYNFQNGVFFSTRVLYRDIIHQVQSSQIQLYSRARDRDVDINYQSRSSSPLQFFNFPACLVQGQHQGKRRGSSLRNGLPLDQGRRERAAVINEGSIYLTLRVFRRRLDEQGRKS